MPKRGAKRIGVDLQPETHKALKLAATEAGSTISDVIRQLINEHLIEVGVDPKRLKHYGEVEIRKDSDARREETQTEREPVSGE